MHLLSNSKEVEVRFNSSAASEIPKGMYPFQEGRHASQLLRHGSADLRTPPPKLRGTAPPQAVHHCHVMHMQ
jgi:hypothetical protein